MATTENVVRISTLRINLDASGYDRGGALKHAVPIGERAEIGRRLKWQSPVLRWCVENVAIHTDSAGNRVMHKGKSRERIDLAVALWMAVARAAAGESNVSIYSTDERPEGLRFV